MSNVSVEHSTRTSFARLGPRAARTVLLLFALACVASVAVTVSPWRAGNDASAKKGAGDVALYRATVDRMDQGQEYYDAMGSELKERGYPTHSPFNWRMPMLLSLIAWLPDSILAKVVLCGVALMALGLGFSMLAQHFGVGTAVWGGVLMTGAAMPCLLGDLFYMSEVWSGTLMGLSIAAYGTDRRKLATVAGLLALFIRELVTPYAFIVLYVAVFQKRWREAAVWKIGMTAYAIFVGHHIWTILATVEASARSHDQSWIQFGGWPFLIGVAQMNAYLLVLPQWVAALYLTAAALGLAAWTRRVNGLIALTGFAFLLTFAVIGQPFNQYWGSLIVWVLCFGAAAAPVALRDLWRAAGFAAHPAPSSLREGSLA